MQPKQASLTQAQRNSRIAAGVAFFTSLYFYLPVMTIYLTSRGLNILQISVMHGVILAAQSLAEVPTGVLADRWGRKTAWALAIGLQFIGEAWFFFARSYGEYLWIAVIGGIGFAFGSGAVEALVVDSFPSAERSGQIKKALGSIAAASRVGNILAFLISGWIFRQIDEVHFLLAIGLTAAAVGIGAFLTLLATEPQRKISENHIQSVHSFSAELRLLRSGWQTLRSQPSLLRLAGLMIFTDPFGFYLISLIQIYYGRAGVPGSWFGPALAVGSVLAALSENNAYRLDHLLRPSVAVVWSAALPGLIYLVMAPIQSPFLAVAAFLVLYSVAFASRPLLRGLINQSIPSENRATVLSMIQLIQSLYLAVIGAVLGWIGDRSVSGVFWTMGGLILCSVIAYCWIERKKRTRV